uniref:Mitochondrial import inner membrane translocase subunit n=1 Tax=Stygiella incarcerata TaxID=1712417 RepID=A0A192ZJ89_9EUKA|nr:Tim8 [Stygiella incarcerata]
MSDRDMERFIHKENQRHQIQQVISRLTDKCFAKCVKRPGAKLSSSETQCVQNCVERFLDASVFIMKLMSEDEAKEK